MREVRDASGVVAVRSDPRRRVAASLDQPRDAPDVIGVMVGGEDSGERAATVVDERRFDPVSGNSALSGTRVVVAPVA